MAVGPEPSPGKRLRLFVALEIPEPWRAALAQASRRLDQTAAGFGRWVDPSLLHLTLVFLGNQPATSLEQIGAAVKKCAVTSQPYSLELEDVGWFGSSRSVRVVWVGVADRPRGALARLQGHLVESLSQAGVPFEAGRFSPHITLARARRGATTAQSEAMHQAVQHAGAFHDGLEALAVEEMVLIRSDLRPTGPIYTPLRRFARVRQLSVGVFRAQAGSWICDAKSSCLA